MNNPTIILADEPTGNWTQRLGMKSSSSSTFFRKNIEELLLWELIIPHLQRQLTEPSTLKMEQLKRKFCTNDLSERTLVFS